MMPWLFNVTAVTASKEYAQRTPYLLPGADQHAMALVDLAEQVNADGGHAWVVDVVPRSTEDAAAFKSLFDRSDE